MSETAPVREADPAREASEADDALLFVHGIGTRYFAEVVTVLRAELMARDPAQAEALDRLYARLGAMRDLLEQRLAEMHQLELIERTVRGQEEAHRGNTDSGELGVGASASAGIAGQTV
jgi:hypothetical protein